MPFFTGDADVDMMRDADDAGPAAQQPQGYHSATGLANLGECIVIR